MAAEGHHECISRSKSVALNDESLSHEFDSGWHEAGWNFKGVLKGGGWPGSFIYLFVRRYI